MSTCIESRSVGCQKIGRSHVDRLCAWNEASSPRLCNKALFSALRPPSLALSSVTHADSFTHPAIGASACTLPPGIVCRKVASAEAREHPPLTLMQRGVGGEACRTAQPALLTKEAKVEAAIVES